MAINSFQTKEKVTISKLEYDLLNEVYKQFKRQFLLMRIMEAEENVKDGKVKKVSVDEFIKSI